jgi:DNA-binding NtrC family response regulator
MARRSRHCDSKQALCKLGAGGASRNPLPEADKTFAIGFYSLHQPDPDEALIRAALESAAEFGLHHLEFAAGSEGPMPSALAVTALSPRAVIVVITTHDRNVVKPLFARLRLGEPHRPILVAPRRLTADAISQVLECGASDFLLPPYHAEDLVPRLRRLLGPAWRQDSQIGQIKVGVGLRQIVGESRVFLAEVNKLSHIASCDAAVLIRGESGTGKEVFARAIHYLSARSEQPFVPINCGAIPVELAESELFGHQRGAFTGAVRDRIGLVREADGGTMLLDEVDALPLTAQVKLLRFLQDGEFRPLGASRTDRARVRVVAATNADFDRMIQDGKFREDLYYRLNVLRLALPPLRDRPGDLPLLAHHLLEKQALTLGCALKPLTADALTRMAGYRWPGNIRELENILTRALIFSEGVEIEVEDLALPARSPKEVHDESFRTLKAGVIRDFERAYLQQILDRYGGNITRAAHAAAKNRRAFWELLRKHDISLHRARCPNDSTGSQPRPPLRQLDLTSKSGDQKLLF